jgi:hypothetical protein
VCYLIQRRAPSEPPSYWGRAETWVIAPPHLRFSQIGQPAVPASACRFDRFDVAHEVAEALRLTSLEHGVVIAVIPDPRMAAW